MRVGRILICVYNTNKDSLLLLLLLLPAPMKYALFFASEQFHPRQSPFVPEGLQDYGWQSAAVSSSGFSTVS